MLLNPVKTKSMVVATRRKYQCGLPPLRLMLNSQVIEHVSEHRHLGVFLDDQRKWQAHKKKVLLTLLLKMCILSLAPDTFVTVKLAIYIYFFCTYTLCPELIMAALMYISIKLNL